MTPVSHTNHRHLDEAFSKALPHVRRRLLHAGLSIVAELELSEESHPCRVLLVDAPVLTFEAIALDRSSAVFLPMHVAVCGTHDGSQVSWSDPVANSGVRIPAPARGPLATLAARLMKALADLPDR